jgi:hypothetical protein
VAFDPRLGEAFAFDAVDLAANNAGRLSPEQERLLGHGAAVGARRQSRATVAVIIVFGLAIVVTAGGIAVTPGSGPEAALVAAGILAFVAGIVVWGMRRGRRLQRTLTERRLLTTEGRLAVRTSYNAHWYAHVGAARIGVDRYQAETLCEGGTYRVHYLSSDDGAIPMSLELLAPAA